MKLAERKKKQEDAVLTTKICPYCKSEIPLDATKCAHCTSDVEQFEGVGFIMIMETGKSGLRTLPCFSSFCFIQSMGKDGKKEMSEYYERKKSKEKI